MPNKVQVQRSRPLWYTAAITARAYYESVTSPPLRSPTSRFNQTGVPSSLNPPHPSFRFTDLAFFSHNNIVEKIVQKISTDGRYVHPYVSGNIFMYIFERDAQKFEFGPELMDSIRIS